MIDSNLLGQILILGAVTGMRSILGIALLAWCGPPLGWLSSIWGRGVTGLAAIGELIGDKLPKTPSRLSPGPLGGRLVLGGIVGWLLTVPSHAPVWIGAPLGAAAAAAGAFAGNKLRAAAGRKTGVPDLYFAALEDLIAIGAGLFALLGPLATR
jgi:uncharacterized membrane protein